MQNPAQSKVEEFSREYQDLADKVSNDIQRNLEKGLAVEVAVSKALRANNFSQEIADGIYKGIAEAGALGYGVKDLADNTKYLAIFDDTFGVGDQIKNTPFKSLIVDQVRTAIRKNEGYIKLSLGLETKLYDRAELPIYMKRIINQGSYITDAEFKRDLKIAVGKINKLSLNGSPNRALKASYLELVDLVQGASEKHLTKAVEIAVKEKARYLAERIARTEIARSYGLSFDFKNLQDRDVVGIKYRLSSRHRIYDICNFHTSADLYDMGKGVYPKERHPPYPFHPHCLCIPSQVFISETGKGIYNREAGENWIKSRKPEEKQALMGKIGVERFKQNGKFEGVLRNWDGHKKVDIYSLSKDIYK